MKKAEVRYDRGGRLVTMAVAKNWRMIRRPGCVPSVIFESDWQKLSTTPWTAEMIAAHDAKRAEQEAHTAAVMGFLMTGRIPDGAVVKEGLRPRPAAPGIQSEVEPDE